MPLRTEGVLGIIFPRRAFVSRVKSLANSRETLGKRVQLVFVAEGEALLTSCELSFTHNCVREVWNAPRMERRTATGKSCDRQVEAPPEKMHRADLANEAGAKVTEHAIGL
jgi:hypothetical protein